MKFELPFWLSFFSSWMILTWMVFRVFKELGDTLKEETNIATALWLLNLNISKNKINWASQLAVLFDRIFTKKHLSWSCFFRSSLTSILFGISISFLFFIFQDLYITKKIEDVEKLELFQNYQIREDKLSGYYYYYNPKWFENLPLMEQGKKSIHQGEWQVSEEKFEMELSKILYSYQIDELPHIYQDRIGEYRKGIDFYYKDIERVLFQLGGDSKKVVKIKQLLKNDSLYISEIKARESIVRDIPSRSNMFQISFIIIIIFTVNLIADYFSLLQTRFFIRLMEKHNQPVKWLLFLLMDFIITGFIFFVIIFIVLNFFSKISYSNESLSFFTREFLSLFSINSPYIVPLLTTYITSIWLWLYAISGFSIKALNGMGIGLEFLKKHLDIENKPFRSIGVFTFIFITIGYIFWGTLLLL